jgi:hypothetical protein
MLSPAINQVEPGAGAGEGRCRRGPAAPHRPGAAQLLPVAAAAPGLGRPCPPSSAPTQTPGPLLTTSSQMEWTLNDVSARGLSPSGADPSLLAGEPIETEDDVLHVTRLPTFGGVLRGHECELLLQYLTPRRGPTNPE